MCKTTVQCTTMYSMILHYSILNNSNYSNLSIEIILRRMNTQNFPFENTHIQTPSLLDLKMWHNLTIRINNKY